MGSTNKKGLKHGPTKSSPQVSSFNEDKFRGLKLTFAADHMNNENGG